MSAALLLAILQAAMAAITKAGPAIALQHWDGKGPDAQLNNAVQIMKDASAVGGDLMANLAASPAVTNAHTATVATATATVNSNPVAAAQAGVAATAGSRAAGTATYDQTLPGPADEGLRIPQQPPKPAA